jgi:site-specific DNA-methyltransferase (cytosine-N4-specific)
MTATPTWASDTAALYTGDALDVLSAMPGSSVHCVVTSPPYWGLRDYGTGTWRGGDTSCAHSVGRGTNTAQSRVSGSIGGSVDYPASPAHRGGDPRVCRRCGATRVDRQYGLEPTPEDYVDTLRRVFAELRRVLDPAGTVWLNLGDSYSSEPPGQSYHAMRHSTLAGRTAAEQARESVRRADVDRITAVPRKNLLGMPWRVALALQADGWILRNAIVWAKRNPMPESVRDRLSTTYEFVFLLTTGSRYHFDLDPIRVPLVRPEALTEDITVGGTPGVRTGAVGASARRRGGVYGAKYRDPAPFAHTTPGAAIRPTGRRHDATHPRGKNPGDVWHLSTRPLREAHFATFPIDIPLRCIAAGCPPDGVVLDPFSGAATTGMAALHLGRRYIGIDLNPDYTALAQRRLTTAAHQRGHQPTSGSSPTPEARP